MLSQLVKTALAATQKNALAATRDFPKLPKNCSRKATALATTQDVSSYSKIAIAELLLSQLLKNTQYHIIINTCLYLPQTFSICKTILFIISSYLLTKTSISMLTILEVERYCARTLKSPSRYHLLSGMTLK
mmetsp:Transcript_40432/g.41087  ORF Transcript_40432/g.41087 Transcript_40432/m.41087 type:complete len:132 (+) Transcript_40432:203-598(+)